MATTSFDLSKAGDFFQSSGLAINQRIHSDLGQLEFHEIQELSNRSQELLVKSKTLFAMSVIQIESEAKDSFQSVENAKADIDAVIKKVKEVQSIIDFSAKLVSFASALIKGDVATIISNGQSIITDISNLV